MNFLTIRIDYTSAPGERLCFDRSSYTGKKKFVNELLRLRVASETDDWMRWANHHHQHVQIPANECTINTDKTIVYRLIPINNVI